MALQDLVQRDGRAERMDLGVGVYRDAEGRTPVMQVVKAAEEQLLRNQASKVYLSPAGDAGFLANLIPLVLGEAADPRRLAMVQAPGGCGALRLAFDLARQARPEARVLVGVPTWPNHLPIAEAVGLRSVTFEHHDPASGALRFDGLLEAVKSASPGDVLILHGCCHNPTGVDLSPDQWEALGAAVAAARVTPLVDLAYLGFGDGLEADAEGLRRLLALAPEAMVAVSCSKIFSLYRERTGALIVLTEGAREAETVRSNLLHLARTTYSSPPDHGAAVVRIVLDTPRLEAAWRAELEAMRQRIAGVRRALASAAGLGLQGVVAQRGMFAMLPLHPTEVARLRRDHAIYLPDNGRISLAGLNPRNLDRFVTALAEVRAAVPI